MPFLGLPTGNFGFGHRSSPTTNLVALLDFEGAGNDLTFPRKTTTYYGNAETSSSIFKFGSQALYLQGGQDRVEVKTSVGRYANFTLEAQVYYTQFSNYTPIIAIGTDENNYLSYASRGNDIRVTIVQNGIQVFDQISSHANIPLFQWHHYALVCDDTGMRFMVDGVSQQYYNGLSFPFDVDTVSIGNQINGATNDGLVGYIDEVRFMKTARPDSFFPPLDTIVTDVDQSFTLRAASGSVNNSTSGLIYLYGFNFDGDYIVQFYDANTNVLLITSSSVTTINKESLSASTDTSITPLLVGTPLSVRVESVKDGTVKFLNNAFVVNNGPSWTTAAGTIGIALDANRTVNTTLVATIPDMSPLTYRVISGALPPNTTLDVNTGVISGTTIQVLTTTSYAFTVRVTANNDSSRTADRVFGITVSAPVPSWTTPAALIQEYQDTNRIVSFTLTASVPGSSAITYVLVGGALPTGTTLNASTGTISGTTIPVATETTYSFTVRATAAGDILRTTDRTFSIKVYAPIVAFSTASSLGSTFDLQSKTLSVAAAATSGTVTYSLQSGTLPSGCTLNTSTGDLGTTSTVTSTTDYTFTIRATTSSASVYVDRQFTYRLTFTTDGSTSARAGISAVAIKQITGTTTDGLYYIRPNNSGPVQQIYCDMNTDGGGWMMMARSHPTAGPSSGWGWTGDTIGTVTDFTTAYQAGWYTKFHNYGATFSEWMFGNRANVNNNAWGAFIYKRFNFSYNTFITSDTQQSADYVTLKSTLSVYGTTAPPGMQGAIGFPTTGTANNLYYMRDCCGFSTYGAFPTGMVTTYCNNDSVVYYSGPWCGGSSSDGSGNFLPNVTTTAGNNVYGGTNQYMIMVR
jgi:hypothetical protein